jgi:diacylglycerol kinase family enzyme
VTGYRFGVILNRSGGSADDERVTAVLEELERAAVDHRVYRPDGDPSDDARRAIADGCTALVVGGGDGSVGAVAGVAVEARVPLGVLPLGTLNHFARDLGVPTDPAEAVGVILSGGLAKVDVCCIGDVVFVNNASVGTYARIVARRERLEDSTGKLRAALAAVRAVFPHRPAPVTIEIDGESISTDATIVFFGNNDYVVADGRFTRESIDQGVISVYAMRAPHVWDLLRIAFRIARDRIGRERDLVHRTGRSVRLSVARPSVLVAHDGEVEALPTPLDITVRPGVLRVFVPPDDDAVGAG